MFSVHEMIGFPPTLLHGAWLTILVSLLSFVLALVLSPLTGMGRISRFVPLRAVTAVYVQFIRGTPLLLQLFLSLSIMFCPTAGSCCRHSPPR